MRDWSDRRGNTGGEGGIPLLMLYKGSLRPRAIPKTVG